MQVSALVPFLRAIETKQLVAAKIGDGKTSAYIIERHELENFMENERGRTNNDSSQ